MSGVVVDPTGAKVRENWVIVGLGLGLGLPVPPRRYSGIIVVFDWAEWVTIA